jgi:hypothetical protein
MFLQFNELPRYDGLYPIDLQPEGPAGIKGFAVEYNAVGQVSRFRVIVSTPSESNGS